MQRGARVPPEAEVAIVAKTPSPAQILTASPRAVRTTVLQLKKSSFVSDFALQS
jgi:hypothetical protein